MPTPREPIDDPRSLHTTCPPDDDRPASWRRSQTRTEIDACDERATLDPMIDRIYPPESVDSRPTSSSGRPAFEPQRIAQTSRDDEGSLQEMLSPMSTESDKQEECERQSSSNGKLSSASSSDFSNIRLLPSSCSSFLRSGSRFYGTQTSERQVYDVQVEIKHVDMRESYLCGYLRIQGLTEDHPTLTTFFEGEIIGSKYSFLTQHEDWGSTDKVDLMHWAKFQAFRPYQKQARKGSLHIPNLSQRDNIFMRWKEHFLVPDHRVKTISGASFEGFYYICFNQSAGSVSGIYFHKKSEKFQQLELKHVEDRGCFGAMEFR